MCLISENFHPFVNAKNEGYVSAISAFVNSVDTGCCSLQIFIRTSATAICHMGVLKSVSGGRRKIAHCKINRTRKTVDEKAYTSNKQLHTGKGITPKLVILGDTWVERYQQNKLKILIQLSQLVMLGVILFHAFMSSID